MAELTIYFGLQKISGGDSFGENGWKFSDEDRVIIDRLLYMALSGHHHNGALAGGEGQPDPPELSLDTSSGSLPAATRLYYRITLVDAVGNESIASLETYIDTPDSVTQPNAPAATYESTGGTLLAGPYFYMFSAYTDVNTHESRAVNASTVMLPSGATNRITLDLPDVPDGATGFNIYRRKPGANAYVYLDSIDMSVATPPTNYIDDGSVTEDPNRGVPVTNTTNSSNTVTIAFPGVTPVIPEGYTWKIYRTAIPAQYTNSLLWWVVETTESNGDIIRPTFVDEGQATRTGRPPDVSQQIASPGQIILTDAEEVTGRLPMGNVSAFPFSVTFAYPGTLETAVTGTFVWTCPFPQATIISSRASLGRGSAPSVASVIADVTLTTGAATPVTTTIYANQANRPKVLVGEQIGDVTPTPDITEIVAGDSLSVDLDQITSGATPTEYDLSVTVLLYVYGFSGPSHEWDV